MNTFAPLDKSLDTALDEGYGTITIRVVVLEKGMASAPSSLAAASRQRQAAYFNLP
jgi:hypothetical protein